MAMKATGVVRKIDVLGRIVLPIEIRRNLDIELKDPVEIFVDEDKVILKKYNPACIFCGSMDDIRTINGKIVCKKCITDMKKL
ncbi:MAG: AbrB/MazE/SpoVT family DNA-binding domain-containing protein [Anaerovoracaceae bacterium]